MHREYSKVRHEQGKAWISIDVCIACNRWGVPYWAVTASSLYVGLAYLNVSNSGSIVFNWFVNLTNTSGFISWICCMIVYLRFNKACKTQGITYEYLPYHNKWFQPWGAYVSGSLNRHAGAELADTSTAGCYCRVRFPLLGQWLRRILARELERFFFLDRIRWHPDFSMHLFRA
jgi:hypothetical protein